MTRFDFTLKVGYRGSLAAASNSNKPMPVSQRGALRGVRLANVLFSLQKCVHISDNQACLCSIRQP